MIAVVRLISGGAAVALSLIVAIVMCEVAGTKAMGASPDVKPALTRLVPDSGRAGTAYPLQVTIHGTGFAEKDNEVQFGPMRLTGLPSPDGLTIEFQVPKAMRGRSEVPPLVFPAGDYDVMVTTPAGTSNALTFKLVP